MERIKIGTRIKCIKNDKRQYPCLTVDKTYTISKIEHGSNYAWFRCDNNVTSLHPLTPHSLHKSFKIILLELNKKIKIL
jgi:hypothetical protein